MHRSTETHMTVAQLTPIYTPDDLLRMPDNNTMELVDGQIVEKHVSVESSEIEGNFYFAFRTFLLSHPIAKAFPASLGYQCFDDFPNKIRKPDTTVVLLERLKKLPEPNPGFFASKHRPYGVYPIGYTLPGG